MRPPPRSKPGFSDAEYVGASTGVTVSAALSGVSSPVAVRSHERPSLLHLLRWRSEQQADRRALTFIHADDRENHLTYGVLDRRARAVAALLQRQVSRGDRALLIYSPGLDFVTAFLGCLYAGVVAVPVYRPNPRQERTLSRLRPIVRDADPAVVLTSNTLLPMAGLFGAVDGLPGPDRWLATDGLGDTEAQEWREPAIDADTLAFLQYTSGSTATPRGVMISHGNLMHNQGLIQRAAALTEDSSLVSWLPLYHDMGLIGCVLQPLHTGFPATLFSHVDFVQRPERWLQAITRLRATASAAPNFAYDLCISRITPDQRATLDLRSWASALNGAEPIRADTLDRFATAFGPCGFRREAFFPSYGLAEATLLVSGGPVAAEPTVLYVDKTGIEHRDIAVVSASGSGTDGTTAFVGSGRLDTDQRVLIVDPDSRRRCEAARAGEIWVAGPSVSRGYWNAPEATEKTFGARVVDGDARTFLRTGDLGFIHDNQLFVCGRLKDLIIIRGRNHAPQDIEHTAEMSHPALQPGCGVAFSVDVDGDEQLVLVYEAKRHHLPLNAEEVASAIRRAVAEAHELDVYAVVLIKTGTLPKTSSGKVQRRRCRDQFQRDALQQIGRSIRSAPSRPLPRDNAVPGMLLAALVEAAPEHRPPLVVSYLRHQIAGAVGVPPGQISVDESFMALGLDSLRLLELQSRLESELGVGVPLERFLDHPTIAALGTAVLAAFEQSLDALWAEVTGLTDTEIDTRLAQPSMET